MSLVLGCGLVSPERADNSAGASSDGDAEPGLTATSVPVSDSPLTLIVRDRRQFEVSGPGLLRAHIPGVLSAELSADGLTAHAGEDAVSLRTSTIADVDLGRPAARLGGCAPTSETIGGRCAPAAELDHGAATEWWTSGRDGVHQGWTRVWISH